MPRGNPASIPAARAASLSARRKKQAEGLAYARKWREQMRPHFDQLYGTPERCPTCGIPSHGR